MIPLRFASSLSKKMLPTLVSKYDLAHSRTSSAIPPSTTETSDVPGALDQIEGSGKERVEAEQKHIHQPEMPVLEQTTQDSTLTAGDSLDTHTAHTSSTPTMFPGIPGAARPKSSLPPVLDATQNGEGSSKLKRSHEAMAGSSPYEDWESRKSARLTELLFGADEAEDSVVDGSGDGQTGMTNKRSRGDSVDSDEEEPPTKRRVARRVMREGLTYPTWSGASAGSGGEEEEEPPKKKRAARKTRTTRNSLKAMAWAESSAESDGEEPPTKRRVAGVARDALNFTTMFGSSAESDGEDEEEPPTKKRVARKGVVVSNAYLAVKGLIVQEPTTSSGPFFGVKTPGCNTIYSKETSDPRKRPSKPPRESDPTTAATPSQLPPSNSYLQKLPGELRNRIYHLLGLRSNRMILETLRMPCLIVAYPDLKDELLSIMLSDNRLRVPVYSNFRIKASEVVPHKQKPSSYGPFKVGTVAIEATNWVMKIDPHFVTIKHIGLRILEVPLPGSRSTETPKLICDFFLNVRTQKGKPTTVSHKTMMMASTDTKRGSRCMCDLATARAKRFAAHDGFIGFTWKQVQEIAASFESVIEAKAHFTKKNGKVTLNEASVSSGLG